MKAIRIFLLVLIIIGIGLLLTQHYWVPSVTEFILKYDKPSTATLGAVPGFTTGTKYVSSAEVAQQKIIEISTSGKTVSITGPSLLTERIAKCVNGSGWYGYGGNGLFIDWGDGTKAAGSGGTQGASCAEEEKAHTYTQAGTYSVYMRAWHPGPTDARVVDWEGSVSVTVL